MTNTEQTERLRNITVLQQGKHDPDRGYCLLEAVAYVAGEPWSDRPACVSPVLAAFGRNWNDGMQSNAKRASLIPYIPLLIGTAGDAAADEARGWMALDWLIREHAVAWLALAGGDCAVHAARLAALPVVDKATVRAVAPALDAAGAAAMAAGAAAWDAAGAAAGAATRAAARDAARDAAMAARTATRAAARDAAWDAAMAARAAAWDAAMAAGDAAGDAAMAARATTRAAARAARAATRAAAARAALAPPTKALQVSTHDLFRRMIEAGSARGAQS